MTTRQFLGGLVFIACAVVMVFINPVIGVLMLLCCLVFPFLGAI